MPTRHRIDRCSSAEVPTVRPLPGLPGGQPWAACMAPPLIPAELLALVTRPEPAVAAAPDRGPLVAGARRVAPAVIAAQLALVSIGTVPAVAADSAGAGAAPVAAAGSAAPAPTGVTGATGATGPTGPAGTPAGPGAEPAPGPPTPPPASPANPAPPPDPAPTPPPLSPPPPAGSAPSGPAGAPAPAAATVPASGPASATPRPAGSPPPGDRGATSARPVPAPHGPAVAPVRTDALPVAEPTSRPSGPAPHGHGHRHTQAGRSAPPHPRARHRAPAVLRPRPEAKLRPRASSDATSSTAGHLSQADTALLSQIAALYGQSAGSFAPPAYLVPIYRAAGARYGIPWQVLAAINSVETNYGRDLSVSSAGAEGWMQFLPSTWAEYGVDAAGTGSPDPYDPRDAIFAAASYLSASGGSHDIRAAVFAYNHATWYVDEVLWRAGRIVDPGGEQSLSADGYAVPLELRYMRTLGRTDDGLDIEDAPDGAAVYSITPGIVTAVGADPEGFGPEYPVIEVTEGPLKGRFIYYGHVAASLVKVGQRVVAGQPIAVMGHTGDAAALGHGHIEIGFSDAGGDPLNHHGDTAWTPAGEAMREVLTEITRALEAARARHARDARRARRARDARRPVTATVHPASRAVSTATGRPGTRRLEAPSDHT